MISGTPTAPGTYVVTVTATNSVGTGAASVVNEPTWIFANCVPSCTGKTARVTTLGALACMGRGLYRASLASMLRDAFDRKETEHAFIGVLANNGPTWVRAFHPVVAVLVLALAGSFTGRLWREHRAAPAG